MANYTAIADTSERLVQLLRRELSPDVIIGPNEIGLKSPEDKTEVSLGVFLYDVQISEEVYSNRMTDVGVSRQKYPPVCLNLYYMLTAYSAGDVKYQMAQEEKILGRVIQAFHDYPTLPPGGEGGAREGAPALRIQMQRMNMEEKARIWNFGSLPYKLSLFYKISPVVIESTRRKEVVRVREIELSVEAMEQNVPFKE